jgi:penicillin amidase
MQWLAAGLLALVASSLWLGWRNWWRRGLPQLSGRIVLPGLRAPVEILRDRWGVPHIFATSEQDLVFAQGVVHAQDRLWQMEMFRRLGHGRLSEIFGEAALPLDKPARILGWSESAERDWQSLDESTRQLLQSYANGVNAMLIRMTRKLPPEFRLLRYLPEPWQPTDTLVWSKVMSWGLSVNWISEVLHTVLVSRLGAQRAAELVEEYPLEHPVIMAEQTVRQFAEELHAELSLPEQLAGWPALGMLSNAWVVSGQRSESGFPLLAGDPHLSVQMPGLWYECHLQCPQWEVIGAGIAGAPGIVIGHNADIAWSLTAALPDTQDLYWERIRQNGSLEVEHCGQWKSVEVRQVPIRVRGWKRPAWVDVIRTRHGPIINALLPSRSSPAQWFPERIRTLFEPLALRHTGDEPNLIARAILKLNRARNWEEFREALRDWTSPPQCFIYADRMGNIGFQMAGLVPVRRQGFGQIPKPGWTDEYEWEGWIPFEQLPHEYNPARGWIVSANHAVAGKEYPYFLTREPLNGYRAKRIIELLQSQPRHNLQSFRRIQLDQHCDAARPFLEMVRQHSDQLVQNSRVRSYGQLAANALQAFLSWDLVLDSQSVGGTIYEVWLQFVCERLYRPWLGEWTPFFLGLGFHPVLNPAALPFLDRSALTAIRLLSSSTAAGWCRDESGQPCSVTELLALAFADTLAYLSKRLGRGVHRWQWGKLHRVEFRHVLGQQKLLGRFFNRGPYAYGGDVNTVWQASFTPNWLTSTPQGFTASYRQLFDLADWDSALAIHTTGQSGHPASRHYDDFIPLWLKGEYHPLLWSRQKIEQFLEGRLVLEPARSEETA